MVLNLPWVQKGMLWVFGNDIFQFFSKFSSGEVETIFWEWNAKASNLFNPWVRRKYHLRKWFSSYFEVKNECSGPLNIVFSHFSNLRENNLNPHSRKARQSFENLSTEKFFLKNSINALTLFQTHSCEYWFCNIKECFIFNNHFWTIAITSVIEMKIFLDTNSRHIFLFRHRFE